jgi:hypothetical protein
MTTKIFYPSQINEFLQCPQKYYLNRVARHSKGTEVFSRALAKGIATHSIVADLLTEYQATRSFPIDLDNRVELALPQTRYRGADASYWLDDLDEVRDNVETAAAWFDGTAEILAIEETLSFPVPVGATHPAFVLRSKVDLVQRHADGQIELVDFKCGKRRRDPIQELASTVVTDGTHGGDASEIVTTTLFVNSGDVISEVLPITTIAETWDELTSAVNAILTGSSWPTKPSALCGWCPFYEDGCPVTATPPAHGKVLIRLGMGTP